jgi:hypothetical protein
MWTQLPTLTNKGSDYDLEPHLTVLHDCFQGKIHSPEAAAKLASAALALDASLDAQLGQLWHLLLQIARRGGSFGGIDLARLQGRKMNLTKLGRLQWRQS